MSRLHGVLLLPILAALALAVIAPGPGAAQAPLRPAEPTDSALPAPSAPLPADQPALRASEPPAPPPLPPGLASSAVPDRTADEVRSVLLALAGLVESGAEVFPEPEIEALRDCLDRRPATADLVVEALGSAPPALRGFLSHAIYRLTDRVLRESLAGVLKATDPEARKLAEGRTDPALLAADLSPERDPRDRAEILARLTAADLAEEEILRAVLFAARCDPDPEIRSLALSRLARSPVRDARDLLHDVAANLSALASDRRAAVRALGLAPDARTGPALIPLLAERNDPALLRLAALGLGRVPDRHPAAVALARLVTDPDADAFARRNAVSSLVSLREAATLHEAAELEALLSAVAGELAQDVGSALLAEELAARIRTVRPTGRYDAQVTDQPDTMRLDGGAR